MLPFIFCLAIHYVILNENAEKVKDLPLELTPIPRYHSLSKSIEEHI